MATQTLATADAILKDVYRGPIIEQINYKTYMLDRIERDADHIDNTGRRAIFPLEVDRNRGRGSIADGGTLPTPGKLSYADAIVTMRYHSAGVELTDQLIKTATGNNEAAFVSSLDAEAKGVAKSLKKDVNRQVYGEGTGLLASITANATSATQTVDSVQYIGVGDPVDVLTRSNGAVVTAGLTVTARSPANSTITLSASVAGTTTEGIYLSGSRLNEMDGLRNIVAPSRILHGLNSATAGNEYWNGHERDLNGAVATEDTFIQVSDLAGAQTGDEIDSWVTTRGVSRRVANQYQSQKRYNDARAVEIKGGYSSIMIAAGGSPKPLVVDDDVPKGNAFGVAEESFVWAELAKPDWLKSDDGTIWHLAPGATLGTRKAAWQAWFHWYAALACLAPNRNARIYDTADEAAS